MTRILLTLLATAAAFQQVLGAPVAQVEKPTGTAPALPPKPTGTLPAPSLPPKPTHPPQAHRDLLAPAQADLHAFGSLSAPSPS
ncbi:hypothetical protein QBC45DRAFT_398192 [Copromyces sp. CBS 386.78]|nr:hypothetical protein QBC45DRAFT_398192 [Copromyces sp. CBS 386.78]